MRVDAWAKLISLALLLGLLVGTDAPAQAGEREELYAACDRAKALETKGDLAAAAQQYEKALAIAPRVLAPDAENLAAILNNLAELYSQLGRYPQAEPLYRRSIQIKEVKLGANHPSTALSLNNLANLYRKLGQFGKAEPLYQRSLAIRELTFGRDHQLVAQSLSNLAVLYQETGDYARATALAQRALEIFTAKLGADHPNVASALDHLATLHHEAGDYAKAEPLYRRSLEIRRAALGPDHLEVAAGTQNLAILYVDLGDVAKAEALAGQALKIREAKLGSRHPTVAASLATLANIYKSSGRPLEAEALYQRSLKIDEAALGAESLAAAQCLYSLGILEEQMGDYPQAERSLADSLKIFQAKLPADHPAIARGLNGLATLYQTTGQYAAAEPLLERSVKIYEAKWGPDHPELIAALNNLAGLYRSMGQYAKAAPLAERCVKIDEQKLGPDHVEVARDLANLALLCQDMGRFDRAEPLFERSLRIMEGKLGLDHPDVASSLNNLAALYQGLGLGDKAEPLFQRSLKIRQAALGADHPDVATSLNNLAVLLADLGQYDQAAPLYERCLAIDQAAFGPDNPDALGYLHNLALAHAAMGRADEAAAEVDRERRIARRHVAGVLPLLDQSEQIAFLERLDRTRWNVALSLGQANAQNASIVARSAAWLANGKAVAHEALAERELLARDSADPAVAAKAAQLRALRSQIAALSQSPSTATAETARRRRVAELSQQEQSLVREIDRAVGRAATADPWIEVDTVRSAVPARALLVDIARIEPAIFTARGKDKRWAPARYVAWLLPPAGAGEIHIVDLGEAALVDAAVERVRAAMGEALGSPGTPGAIVDQGEAGAAAAIEKPLAELAQLALAPILAAAGETRELILSPDASLWLVPWAALPLADGRYAIEAYQMRFVVSARDLVPRGDTQAPTHRPVMMANPDFDLGPGEAQTATRDVLRGAGSGESMTRSSSIARSPSGARSPSSSGSLLNRVAALPGTAAEAKAVAPHLAAFAHSEPILYEGQYALEGIFKALQRPKVLLMSTHGFFLPDQQARLAGQAAEGAGSQLPSASLAADGQPLENPLLRCGLLLAGCNRRDQAGAADDGVLTGLEIVGVDLRGAELVVLSACETGLGQVRSGEGVAGLRQAFQLAGARAVVSTLWQIPDRQSAVLMGDFFANLASKPDAAAALRQAQLDMIGRRRAKYGAAHPVFWAAFTFTGRN